MQVVKFRQLLHWFMELADAVGTSFVSVVVNLPGAAKRHPFVTVGVVVAIVCVRVS